MRPPTMTILAAAAAALAATAVVALPAVGDSGTASKGRNLPKGGATGPGPATVIGCVRSHGIAAPTAPADFKRWLGEQQAGRSNALQDALVACKLAASPQDKANAGGKADCGAPTGKPGVAKPESPGDTKSNRPR